MLKSFINTHFETLYQDLKNENAKSKVINSVYDVRETETYTIIKCNECKKF